MVEARGRLGSGGLGRRCRWMAKAHSEVRVLLRFALQNLRGG
jgi:hypothetical protein